MKTILKQLKLNSAANDEAEILELLDQEFKSGIAKGDLLGAGEWLASMLDYRNEQPPDQIVARILALWASVADLPIAPSSMKELIANLSLFEHENLAKALIALLVRKTRRLQEDGDIVKDLCFRIAPDISAAFSVRGNRHLDVLNQAQARFDTALSDSLNALNQFVSAQCSSARITSVDVLRRYRALKPLVLRREQPLISIAESLLGGGFREFTQSYERGEMTTVVQQLKGIRQHAGDALRLTSAPDSCLWNLLVKPIAEHLVVLADQANRTCRGAITPALKLSSRVFKSDLHREGEAIYFAARLLNKGVGSALNVQLTTSDDRLALDPMTPLDILPATDRLISLQYRVQDASLSKSINLEWSCTDILGEPYRFEEMITLEQQKTQPDWSELLEHPPYSINPIKKRSSLYGREAQLSDLLLYAASSTSTFLWGQKRVGKTSLLQVLQDELSKRARYRCIYLRMGELIGMHEGQLAYTIASRILQGLPSGLVALPQEHEFGAGAGRLIPFVETLNLSFPEWRFLVIIDEFDDLDPSFYTGERGRLFVKALRSLSEIGLTLFFAGSERMNNIYLKHSLELNKWQNMFLDSIESNHDCHALIVRPVENHLEYGATCVAEITAHCGRNPFFLHLFCSELFHRCLAERRTYIGEADAQVSRTTLTNSLGHTNFAHFWEDNPTLDRDENRRFAAENCLVLSCMSSLGSQMLAEDIFSQQESMSIPAHERLSLREISGVLDRLRVRKVVDNAIDTGQLQIHYPIFREWLVANADVRLLPVWRAYVSERSIALTLNASIEATPVATVVEGTFPIPEDDLLTLSSQLVYLGKQKDVAELRGWLRQFDDDNRIEIAFLLLQRLTENGFTSAGAHDFLLSKMVEAIGAHRLSVGAKGWNVVRGRRDNLCLSHVDSELKSGANVARELAKRLQPGKVGDAEAVGSWLKSRANLDPIVVFVDDFSGTGSTITDGFLSWKERCKEPDIFEKLLEERRVAFVLAQTFSEAIDRIKSVEPRISVVAANVFGVEVRAFDPDAGIFETVQEAEFAKEVMLQIGRELTNSMPLGFGDQGALIAFYDTVPNNTLPIFWSNGKVNDKQWKPLFPRA